MKNLLFQLIFIQIGLTLNQSLSASSLKNKERLVGQGSPEVIRTVIHGQKKELFGCAPGGLITSVERPHSKNGRPDLLSAPTRANVVSGRQKSRPLPPLFFLNNTPPP